MRRLALALTLVCTLAGPAVAEPAVPTFDSWQTLQASADGYTWPRPVEKDPALAAGLSAGLPLATLAACSMAMYNSDTIFAGQVGLLAVPLTYGVGQAYAGDPLRGLLVSLGSLLAITGAGLVGGAIADATSTAMPRNYASLGGGIMGGAIGIIAYAGWAGYDAFRTAERYNERTQRSRSGFFDSDR
jgi:hypothetical protein